MFYSEALLSKTGPLARVWLSANLERKLSKSHILQSDIESSVHAIVDQGQAPMALRLSGQLLLGVVRIYSRKARYLLDDCNEALVKIKMAYRLTNNNDLNAVLNLPAGALTLPDAIEEIDLFSNPMVDLFANLDASLLSQIPNLDAEISGNTSSAMDWTGSSPGNPRRRDPTEDAPQLMDDIDLGLDVGDGFSIEFGRDAAPPRRRSEDLFSDDNKLLEDDLELDIDDQPMFDPVPNGIPEPHDNLDNFIGNDDNLVLGDDYDMPEVHTEAAPAPQQERRDSLLSSLRSSVVRDMDDTVEDEVAVRQAQRAKKRKMIQPDAETTIHNRVIKEQQADRSKILKPARFLPRDPFLLTLMNMQKNGDFVSRVLGDGLSKGWAPELRGILSIDIVRKSGDLKRKRDSGISDMGSDAGADKAPALEFEEDDQFAPGDEGVGLSPYQDPSTMINIPGSDGIRPTTSDGQALGDDDGGVYEFQEDFDETTAPLVHPQDSGPVSLGTKHAVHLLRERFGSSPSDSQSPSQSKKSSVLFNDLLPERQTSRVDATKMFFEVLVLATKDAVKVDQNQNEIGGPLRIRGKRGLWGSWAETEAGGEIEKEKILASQVAA